MSDRVATEIAGYRIESLLARGGMGEVYLAHQEFPERRVALKLLARELANDEAFRERFVRESNAAASVEHPNIVPVYGAGEDHGELWIAMRYVEGTDLRRSIEEEGPLSPERAASIVAQVADALDAASRRGLVHRDVKPSNILIGTDDRAYLTDFGLIRRSKLETDLTEAGQFMGTIDYVAPEQIRGEHVDGRADVYSLGCVLYECLTGSPPFVRESEVATLYAHLQDPPPKISQVRPDLPAAIDPVMARAMAKAPAERFATATEFARATQGAIGPTTQGPAGGRKGLVAALIAGLVVAGVVVGVLLSSGGGHGPEQTSAPGSALGPNQIVNMDPETGEILARVSPVPSVTGGVYIIGDAPSIAIGEGGVWAIDANGVAHIDPETGGVIEIGVNPAIDVAVGGGAVWAVEYGARLYRIDAATDSVRKEIPMPIGASFGTQGGPESVEVGDRSVWVASSPMGTLRRVDAATNEILATIPGLGTANDVAFGAGSAWVIDELAGEIARIDPERNVIADRVQVPGRLTKIAADESGVWVLQADTGTVTRLDPTDLSVVDTFRVGDQPTDIQIGLGAVWVANLGSGTVSKIDPVTGAVQTIEVRGPVVALACDEETGTLWLQLAEAP